MKNNEEIHCVRKNVSLVLWSITALIFMAGALLMEFDRVHWAMYVWLTDPFFAGMACSTYTLFYRRIAKITFGAILLIILLVLVVSIGYAEGLAFGLMSLPFVALAIAGYIAGVFLQRKLNRL